jgi:hypothetical protein
MPDFATLFSYAWTIGAAILSTVLVVVPWWFPDFRHWILPKLGLEPDWFEKRSRRIPASKIAPLQSSSDRTLSRIRCPLCRGTGKEWAVYEKTCHKCNGGTTIFTLRAGQPKCPPCRGTGRKNAVYEAECPVCNGVALLPFDFDDEDHLITQPLSQKKCTA